MSPDLPGSVQELARRRADARGRRDWTAADRLRAEIEAAGWKVIDQGLDFRLEPAQPPDRVIEGRILYGSSISVPSLLEEPAKAPVSLVLVAADRRESLSAMLDGLRAAAPPGTPAVIVVDAPGADAAGTDTPDADAPDGDTPDVNLSEGPTETGVGGAHELLWLSQHLSPATAANAGLRRASGFVVVLLDERARPSGDIVTALAEALSDPTVAVAGAAGLHSVDMRRWEPAGPGDVDALAWGAIAFRREDFVNRGPLEERFLLSRSLGPWWSLVLRDEGPDQPPRRARALALPLQIEPGDRSTDGPSAARAVKRDFYRVIDRFGDRYDLLRAPGPRGRRASETA